MTTATRSEPAVELTDEMMEPLRWVAQCEGNRIGEAFASCATYVEIDEMVERAACYGHFVQALEERRMPLDQVGDVLPGVEEWLTYYREEVPRDQESLAGVLAGTLDKERFWGEKTVPTLERAIAHGREEIAGLEAFLDAVKAAG